MDFLPTKGIEYLLAIGYLLLLAPFWWFAVRKQEKPALATATAHGGGRGHGWFRVPDGFHFHRGHTWAQPEDGGLLRVGMDDFARLFLGRPQAFALPAVGARLQQGEKGWSVNVDGHDVSLLSPVRGEVAEVNAAALANPSMVQNDPYGSGWLLKVRPTASSAGLNNLLPAPLARTWMNQTSQRLNEMMAPDLGTVLQDGGELVSGIARELAGDEWPQLAEEMLLTATEEK
jgi:glycine cleavage system H lipoate-binding protein